MTTTSIPIDKLTPLEGNPRTITKRQFEKLIKRLEKDPHFFFLRPCLVNQIGDKLIVYAGNQRLEAARSLGWETVPCIVDENISIKTQKERTLADNLHHGDFHWDTVANEFYDVELGDLGLPESFFQPIDEESEESNIKQSATEIVFTVKTSIMDANTFEKDLDNVLKRYPTAEKKRTNGKD